MKKLVNCSWSLDDVNIHKFFSTCVTQIVCYDINCSYSNVTNKFLILNMLNFERFCAYLFCITSFFIELSLGYFIQNKDRVDVFIVFGECSAGKFCQKSFQKQIIKLEQMVEFEWQRDFLGFGNLKCYLYVIGPSNRFPAWSNLIAQLTIEYPGVFYQGTFQTTMVCQKPCPILIKQAHSFIIL